jgi:cytochrome c biogenesis protein CcdA/thiol-disulfide isomerase/thioredoxin
MILFIISFLAGILTVLAPCVLPLLPVIVGGSLDGKKKALVVTLSLGISVILFTLLLKVSTLFIDIQPEVWSWISGGIITILGLLTLFPALWDKMRFMSKANRESNKLLAVGYKKNSFWGDVIIGASLGPVFSTCSPTYFFILATVLPLQPILGFIDLLAYTIGLCLALLVVAFVGQKILEKIGVASDPYGWFKRTLGFIFVVVGVAIFFGQDKILEAKILESGVFDITKVEQVLLTNISTSKNATSTPDLVSPDTVSPDVATTTPPSSEPQSYVPTEKERIMRKAQLYKKAPELVNPSGFVNTDGKPIKLADYKGKKVVLIDVWTYSCINCQRTLPYVKAWYDKYKDQGLEIVGLHTPEFAFEKVQKNVEDAVKRDGITYPVVLDNDYATWNAYGNQYWPRKYLIDLDGYIIYDHIGEGNYDETEKAIQKALADRASILNTPEKIDTNVAKPKDVITIDEAAVGSPETYFGAMRNQYLGNGKVGTTGDFNFTLPQKPSLNTLYLGGTWTIQTENAISKSPDATVEFSYSSKNVYMVASAAAPIDVDVYVDGVKVKTVTIKDEKLYTLVEGKDYEQHTLLLKAHGAGLQAFTFTFG